MTDYPTRSPLAGRGSVREVRGLATAGPMAAVVRRGVALGADSDEL